MARTKITRASPAPGAGVVFALRAIGLVLFVRWLHAMAQMDWSTLSTMASSPWACVNLVFLFLLMTLPGAAARAERPSHPLPQWLRQALRLFALLGFLFAVWSVGAFVWFAGWRRALHAVIASNGWLVAAPVLYAAVVWICRPQPLWRTNIAARRFAIGRYAISLDVLTRTVVVWMESRKVGQYDARELAIRWPRGTVLPFATVGEPQAAAVPAEVAPIAPVAAEPVAPVALVSPAEPAPAIAPGGVSAAAGAGDPSDAVVGHAVDHAAGPHSGEGAAPSNLPANLEPAPVGANSGPAPAPAVVEAAADMAPEAAATAGPKPAEPDPSRPGVPATSDMPRGRPFSRPKVELLWNSPAAVGHNRKIVMRAPLATEGDRVAARALDATLRQFG
ncbi:hypothetical protein GIY62_15705 [Burkholderia plantarii]|uniref:hypothetical protein n=1 Tax=Burkholderia plantarii TaxID=41899 RepID=UPI00272D7201|nr:hypothetical protein [Burkholderia plantarii]WLE58556.1 hypothetical protein GIY62_15705 [Burkholderia plantarii]